MAESINSENLFKNFSSKFNGLYKDKSVEISQNDMKNIFNSAVKNDADGKLDVKEFLKAAENYDSKKFGNKSFAEKSSEYEDFAEAFNDIGMLDGIDGLSSNDIAEISADKPQELSEFKPGAKIKTENNKNYVSVEKWSSDKTDGNDCLERIIKNGYDLDALGIKPGSKEYAALEKAVTDANENIYGENSGRKRIVPEQNNTVVLYSNDKIVLPKVSEIEDKDLQNAVIKSARKAGKTYTVTNSTKDYTSDTDNPRTVKNETIYNPDGTKTLKESTSFKDGHSIIVEKNNDKNTTITSQYDKDGNLSQKSEITSKVSGDYLTRTITEKLTDKDGVETQIVKTENLKTGEIAVISDNTRQVKAKSLSYSDIEYRIEFISFQEPGASQIKALRDDVYYSNLTPEQKINLNKIISKLDEAENKRQESKIDGHVYGYSGTEINKVSSGKNGSLYNDLESKINFVSFEYPGADQIKKLRDEVYSSGLPDNQRVKLQMQIDIIENYYNKS